MMVLVTYDVNITEQDGAKRLRKVAKICENYGIRVQNSVFEMLIDPAQLVSIKSELSRIIDNENDSVRFYLLGKNWNNRVETMGKQTLIKQGGTLIL